MPAKAQYDKRAEASSPISRNLNITPCNLKAPFNPIQGEEMAAIAHFHKEQELVLLHLEVKQLIAMHQSPPQGPTYVWRQTTIVHFYQA